MERVVEFRGVLHVQVSKETNKAKQHPLAVDFIGEDGEVLFSAYGARMSSDGRVLNSQSALPSGRVISHSYFAPSLQEAIANGHDDELADEQVDALKDRDDKIAYHEKRAKELINDNGNR